MESQGDCVEALFGTHQIPTPRQDCYKNPTIVSSLLSAAVHKDGVQKELLCEDGLKIPSCKPTATEGLSTPTTRMLTTGQCQESANNSKIVSGNPGHGAGGNGDKECN